MVTKRRVNPQRHIFFGHGERVKANSGSGSSSNSIEEVAGSWKKENGMGKGGAGHTAANNQHLSYVGVCVDADA